MDNSNNVPDLNQLYGTPVVSSTTATVPDLNQLYGSSQFTDDTTVPLYQRIANAEESIGKKIMGAIPGVNEALEAIGNRPELQPVGAGQGLSNNPVEAALQTVALPIRAGATLASAPDTLGQAASNIGQQAGYPLTGAAIGTMIKMAPYVTGAYGAEAEMYDSDNPYVKGLINNPKELGMDYKTQNALVGITKRDPVFRGYAPRFPDEFENDPTVAPTSYPALNPKNPGSFTNYVRDRLDQYGDKLSPQELNDMRKGLGTLIRSGRMADDLEASASELNSQATQTLNKVVDQRLQGQELPEGTIPTRTDLNKAYAISKTLHPAIANIIRSGISRFLPWVVRGAAAGAGMKGMEDLLGD